MEQNRWGEQKAGALEKRGKVIEKLFGFFDTEQGEDWGEDWGLASGADFGAEALQMEDELAGLAADGEGYPGWVSAANGGTSTSSQADSRRPDRAVDPTSRTRTTASWHGIDIPTRRALPDHRADTNLLCPNPYPRNRQTNFRNVGPTSKR